MRLPLFISLSGLYNWWIGKLKNGEKWPGWQIAKKSLQESKHYDPELNQVYGKLLFWYIARRGPHIPALECGVLQAGNDEVGVAVAPHFSSVAATNVVVNGWG